MSDDEVHLARLRKPNVNGRCYGTFDRDYTSYKFYTDVDLQVLAGGYGYWTRDPYRDNGATKQIRLQTKASSVLPSVTTTLQP